MFFAVPFFGAGAVAFVVTASPTSGYNGGAGSAGNVTSSFGPSTSIEGGTAPFTYSWTHLNTLQGGTPTINNASVASPQWTALVSDNIESVSSWKLEVTDAKGQTDSVTVQVTLSWFNANGGA